ncbi:hypothetical protein NKH47_08155 [Mesorhizobium sp. M1060]|uniref:hypothetical protein n=1 Tax=Mesorhizobium sp. M1060 TaxID=2957052 RepID=UPI00333945E3
MADIKTIAGLILAKGSNDTFNFVVRWVLGDFASDALPAFDAVFDVVVQEAEITALNPLPPKGQPLIIADFKINPIKEVFRGAVSPQPYFMLDTVRHPADWPYAIPGQWMQVTRPVGPPMPATLADDDLASQPFGVINLLQESERGRVAQRITRVVSRSMERAMRERTNLAKFAGNEYVPGDLASRFANWLVHSNARPAHLPHIIRQAAARISGTEAALSRSLTAMPEMALWSAPSATPSHNRLKELALVAGALSVGSTFDDVSALADEATQVRGHIRMRTLHGGQLIDHWSDPENGGAGPQDYRGRQFAGSEVLGLGKTFTMDRAALQAISDARHGFVVTVTQTSAGTTTMPPYDPGQALLFQERELKRALKGGTSHPPPKPTGARMNYELVEVPQAADATMQMEGRALGFRTGDGRVEIIIDPLPEDSTASAWNVYGMWEGHKDSQKFFDDPNAVPTLDDLSPWLMTRRYSFARDLAPSLVDSKGVPLATLDIAMRQPPWQPILPIPDSSDDRTDEKSGGPDKPLPVKGDKGSARFAFDLRKGFIVSTMKPAGDVPEWDIASPPDSTWSARNWRPGSTKAKIVAPQRYRFWVTAVDQFDQEGAPKEVVAADIEAGETAGNIFYLRQRSRLMPPPGDKSDTPLSLTRTGLLPFQLALRFSTPYASHAATHQEAGAPVLRADPATLVAWASIWRKRPKFEPAGEIKPKLAARGTGPWQADIEALIQQGWEQVIAQEIAAPGKDGSWGFDYNADDLDAGYLFIGVAAFRIKPEYAQFWASDVAKRTAQLVKRDGDNLSFYSNSAPEVVLASPLAKTAELLVADSRLANLPKDAAVQMIPALPVLPPAGLDRDLVLQRLVSSDFVDQGKTIDPSPWPDDVVQLTIGQIAMCESALERVQWAGKSPAAADLTPARKILAMTTTGARQQSASADPNKPAAKPEQSPTIGFRGMAELSWTYMPMASFPEKNRPQAAEAAAFKIYQVRTPLETGQAKQASACRASVTVSNAGSVQFQTDVSSVIASIIAGIPALALLEQANGLCLAYSITGATPGASANTAAAQLVPLDGAPLPAAGKPVSMTLHLGHALWIVEQNPVAPETNRSLLVPVGGGPQEVFAWWIVPMSYAGLEARPQDCPSCHWLLQGSIQPPAPADVLATQPTRTKEHLLKNVAKYRSLLPDEVANDVYAASLPRLVINWTPGDKSSDVYLLIERDEQEVTRQHKRFAALVDSEWDALKAIEGLKDGAGIEKEWLDRIRQGWLAGHAVESEPAAPDSFRRIGSAMEIPVNDGIVQLTDPTKPYDPTMLRPTFIDYYGRNGDNKPAMDGGYEFRYRLRSFRYLGTTQDGPQYLYSRPTAWTDFAIPERPPISVTQRNLVRKVDATLYGPRVTFQLSPALRSGEKNPHWFYRALVRRYVEVPMPSVTPVIGVREGVWIDIGKPALIEWDGTVAEITDVELRREWAGQGLQPKYRVLVQAFRRDMIDGLETDVVMRSFDERSGHDGYLDVPLDVPGLASETADERDLVVPVDVL